MKKGLLIFLLMLVSIPSFAENVPKSRVEFLCTGIGESKNDPQNNEYPAKVIFASTSRALYSDVTVTVMNAEGATLLQTFCDASWLLIKLEPGTYQIKGVDQKQQERRCTLNLKPKSHAQCVLTWPET